MGDDVVNFRQKRFERRVRGAGATRAQAARVVEMAGFAEKILNGIQVAIAAPLPPELADLTPAQHAALQRHVEQVALIAVQKFGEEVTRAAVQAGMEGPPG